MADNLYQARSISEIYLGSSALAALKASWTAALLAAIGSLIFGGGSEVAGLFLFFGCIVSFFAALIHSIFFMGMMLIFYRTASRNDSGGQLFGRWWVLHNLSVWVIPGVLMYLNGETATESWGFLLCVAINSNAVLWLFCKRFADKRDRVKGNFITG
ncbi:MAG: hypothetical protein AAFQ87_12615 [Bacteroidota bacterium]